MKKWSRVWRKCRNENCTTPDSPHGSNGYCESCYRRAQSRKRIGYPEEHWYAPKMQQGRRPSLSSQTGEGFGSELQDALENDPAHWRHLLSDGVRAQVEAKNGELRNR